MEWFFDKTDFSLYAPLRQPNNWLDLIANNQAEPNFTPYMALVGIDPNVADAVRKQFFLLKKGRVEKYHVSDLGNIKLVPHRETNEMRICEVCKNLLTKGIIPMILGGMSEISFPLYQALHEFLPQGNIACFESSITHTNERMILRKIFQSEIPKPFNVLFAGYQEYLCDRERLVSLEDDYYELVSLGMLRQNFKAIEPPIRDAHMFAFNANTLADPIGLTAEEAAQLAWYAGMNENMSLFSLLDFSNAEKHAKTAAVMLWYFIEGAHQSYCEKPQQDKSYDRFFIPLSGHQAENMLFLRSRKSDRWWYVFRKNETDFFAPASYEDYLLAQNGNIPESWWRAHNRVYFGR